MLYQIPLKYDSTTRLIKEMVEKGREADDYSITDLTFTLAGRDFVEIILSNNYNLLFYKSLGLGTGIESKGEWTPTPAINSDGWILKLLYLNEWGTEVNPKFTKYDVPLYQKIAKELKEKYNEK